MERADAKAVAAIPDAFGLVRATAGLDRACDAVPAGYFATDDSPWLFSDAVLLRHDGVADVVGRVWTWPSDRPESPMDVLRRTGEVVFPRFRDGMVLVECGHCHGRGIRPGIECRTLPCFTCEGRGWREPRAPFWVLRRPQDDSQQGETCLGSFAAFADAVAAARAASSEPASTVIVRECAGRRGSPRVLVAFGASAEKWLSPDVFRGADDEPAARRWRPKARRRRAALPVSLVADMLTPPAVHVLGQEILRDEFDLVRALETVLSASKAVRKLPADFVALHAGALRSQPLLRVSGDEANPFGFGLSVEAVFNPRLGVGIVVRRADEAGADLGPAVMGEFRLRPGGKPPLRELRRFAREVLVSEAMSPRMIRDAR